MGCSVVDVPELLGVVLFAASSEHTEVGENVVLGVASNPSSVAADQHCEDCCKQ